MTRSRSNADHLPRAVAVVEGDVTDKERMRDSMTGVDGVFHIAAWYYVGPGPRNETRAAQINVEGTQNVLELVDELEIPKAVYTSTLGVYPFGAYEHIDESLEPSRPESAVYYRTKWQAHYEVAKPMMERGLPLVVVLPGVVYGPGDKSYGSIRMVFQEYLRGKLAMIPRDHVAPWDYVADIADAHVRAMDHGEPGAEYIISGPPRETTEVFECAERLTGVPAPRAVSPRVFGGLSTAMGVLERFVTPPPGYESESLDFFAGTGGWPADTAKATAELGITHRSLEDGLREYLPWELDQLGIPEETGPNAREVAPQ